MSSFEWIVAGGVSLIACQLAIIIGLLRKILAEAAKPEPPPSLDRDIAEEARRARVLEALNELDSQLTAVDERFKGR